MDFHKHRVMQMDSKYTSEMNGIQYYWKLFKAMTSWLTSQEATTVMWRNQHRNKLKLTVAQLSCFLRYSGFCHD